MPIYISALQILDYFHVSVSREEYIIMLLRFDKNCRVGLAWKIFPYNFIALSWHLGKSFCV